MARKIGDSILRREVDDIAHLIRDELVPEYDNQNLLGWRFSYYECYSPKTAGYLVTLIRKKLDNLEPRRFTINILDPFVSDTLDDTIVVCRSISGEFLKDEIDIRDLDTIRNLSLIWLMDLIHEENK